MIIQREQCDICEVLYDQGVLENGLRKMELFGDLRDALGQNYRICQSCMTEKLGIPEPTFDAEPGRPD